MLALGVLLALGTWQLQRKAWKEGLIARIAERTRAAPVDLPAGPGFANPSDREYLHVAVAGRLLHDKERYLYAPTPAGLGWHVFTPMETTSGQLVWINRGWVPDARKDPATRPQGQMPGTVRITGLIREVPAPATFTPANDAARNLWYWPDIAAMTQAAFRNTPGATMTALPFWIDADAQPGAARRPAQRRGNAARPAQPAPGIRHHLVRPGADADRCLFSLRRRPAEAVFRPQVGTSYVTWA